jgi:hypothetical protein
MFETIRHAPCASPLITILTLSFVTLNQHPLSPSVLHHLSPSNSEPKISFTAHIPYQRSVQLFWKVLIEVHKAVLWFVHDAASLGRKYAAVEDHLPFTS